MKSQSVATTGNFFDMKEVFALPGEGDNDGSLYADQDTTFSGLTVFGFGKIFIQGSNPEPPGFGGTAESSVTINFLLSETTAYTLSGLLNELEDGGSAFAQATLLDSLLSPIFDFQTTADDPVLLLSDSGSLAAGVYTLQVKSFGVGSAEQNFFDLAGFDFNFELVEQQVVPEPASMAVWTLIGVSFIGVHRWRRRTSASV